jgi:hypothetical protein
VNPSAAASTNTLKRQPLIPAAADGDRPKLGFLAQLTARVGLKSSTAAASAEGEEATQTSAPAAKGGIAGAARSLFADIARFRKNDAEESAVVGAGAAACEEAEDKENGGAARANTVSAAGEFHIITFGVCQRSQFLAWWSLLLLRWVIYHPTA